MKIGFLIGQIPPYAIGGSEIQTMQMAEGLSKRGHEVIIFTRHHCGKKIEHRKKVKVIKSRFINIFIIRTIVDVISTLNLIKKEKPDILFAQQLLFGGLIGALAKKLFDIPLISWIQGEGTISLNQNLTRIQLIKFVIGNSNKIIVQTQIMKRIFLKNYSHKNIEIIPNGIYLSKETANGNNIIFVGRLVKEKGVGYLIEAVKGLKNKTIIVGDGPERKKLERVVGTNIKFIGRVPNVLYHLKKGKIFILPTLRHEKTCEGLPNVILEAMNVGLPIISCPVGGIPDVIKNGYNGILVEPENPKQLREAILKLMTNEKLRKQISKNCKKEIRKYSWEKVIPKIEKSIKVLVEK